MSEKVSIRHRPGTYSVYRNLSNTPWYALAEYVDNAIQSFEANEVALRGIEGSDFKARIDLVIEAGHAITIRDNAAGISAKDFVRAFEPANKPENDQGLSEFGMGLKVASIWFGDCYSVRTSALGETVVKEVNFDLHQVTEKELEELAVTEEPANENDHFTEIVISGLSKNAPTGNPRQIAKIKSHIASIYRIFIRERKIEIAVNGEVLSYEEPAVLKAPFWNDLNGPDKTWRKEISIETEKYKVSGFIGLLETMKQEHAGLSLFRRGRVIQGSHDEKYKNQLLSGTSGSPRDKRLFGELELSGFEVSFEKGRFIGLNDDFVALFKLVREELSRPEFNLIQQGDKYTKKSRFLPSKTAASLAKVLKKETKRKAPPLPIHLPKQPPEFNKAKVPSTERVEAGSQAFEVDGHHYLINLVITHRKGDSELYYLERIDREDKSKVVIEARLNLEHPFFRTKESRRGDDSLEALVTLIKTLVLSEVHGPTLGLKHPQVFRTTVNSILKRL